MTREEAIDCFKHPTQHFPSEREEADRMAVEALERVDKYRPHDLLKNPDDLPDEFKPVLASLVRGGYAVVYVDKTGWYLDYNDYVALCDIGDGYVTAWREIKPFEVDE